jgi:diadenosine tetraphosphate (Ap4A) HIT family hydrolase
MRVKGCYSCDQESVSDRAPREGVVVTDHWRVAHAFNTSLSGWLVLMPRRHVRGLAELGPDETAELGPLLVDLSRALESVTGCVKTYVMLYAEAEGYEHLHFHVVPRMADQSPDERGPRIFARLDRPESEQVPAVARDRLAHDIREALAR